MLALDRLAECQVEQEPFPHLVGRGVLSEAAIDAFDRDFPETRGPGFFPVEDLARRGAFGALITDLRSPAFTREIECKLGVELSSRPQMIVARRWSAARDGRPHTDGADKVATALIYLNPAWASATGALRYLRGPDIDGPGSAPIAPEFGAITAFARSDTSWHGHKPFTGERRVVQVFWLKDEAAAARKDKRHRRAGLLRALWPQRAA